MNMLRIATVEDDAHDLEALRTHLNRYEKENGLKFLITELQVCLQAIWKITDK